VYGGLTRVALTNPERGSQTKLLFGLRGRREILGAGDDRHATARAHRITAARARQRNARPHRRAQQAPAAPHAKCLTRWKKSHDRQNCGM